jgi:predicted permease
MNAAVFWSNVRVALEQVVILYGIVAMGLVAAHRNWFPEKLAQECSKLLFYVITPCVIVRSFLTISSTPQTRRALLISICAGFALHCVGIVLAEPFFRGKRHPDTDPVLHYAAVYGNCGYMALPLAQAIAGEIGVFYCSAIILTFQIFSFTHCAFSMTGGLFFVGAQKNKDVPKFRWKNLFLNAGVLSVLVGLPIFLLRLPVPAVVQGPIDFVAAMNTPLAMLIFGASLSHTKGRAIFKNPKFLLTLFLKLFAMPAVTLFLLRAAGVESDMLKALMISASAPSAGNTVMFAAFYHRDAGYAAQVVALISFASILTMPLFIAVAAAIQP